MSKFEYGFPKLSSTVEDFEKVIIATRQLLDQEKIKILFGFESNINIIIDKTALDKIDIDENKFNEILNSEFMFLLECILDESEDIAMEIPVRQLESEIEIKEMKEKISSKLKLVNEIIVNDDIKKRYLIKKTSNLPKINQLSWEVNKKLFNNQNKEINFNYATITIKLAKEIDGNIIFLFPFLKSESKVEEITFDCDVYDIKKLIEFLEEIKQKLEKTQ